MRNDSVYPKLRFATLDDSKDPEFESPKPVDKTKD
jgi:hypothetical protein